MSPVPLRIVHYLDHFRFDAGGVCRAVMDICSLLAARGHQVTLITQDDTDVPAEWKASAGGVPRAVRLPRPNRADAARLLDGADALHLHGMWTTTNLPFAAAARRLGVPYVFSPHGMLDDWCMGQRTLKKRLFLVTVGRRMLEGAAAVHCTAQGELEQSRRWFPRGRGVVVPLALDLAPYLDLPGPGLARRTFSSLRPGKPLVLFLSRVHPKKGVEKVIRVAATLRDRGMNIDTAIAGTGDAAYLAELHRLAAGLRVEDRVHFLGMVTGAAKTSLYEAADVFLLPTSQENFGFVFFESLASGTPVVTTRGVDTWPDLETSGGAVITDGSVEAMAGATDNLLRNPDDCSTKGARGRTWVLAGHDPMALAARYERMYRPPGSRT